MEYSNWNIVHDQTSGYKIQAEHYGGTPITLSTKDTIDEAEEYMAKMKDREANKDRVKAEAMEEASKRYVILQEAYGWTPKQWEEKFGEGVSIDPKYKRFNLAMNLSSDYGFPPLYHRQGMNDEWAGPWREGVPVVRVDAKHGYGLCSELCSAVTFSEDKKAYVLIPYEDYEWRFVRMRLTRYESEWRAANQETITIKQ